LHNGSAEKLKIQQHRVLLYALKFEDNFTDQQIY